MVRYRTLIYTPGMVGYKLGAFPIQRRSVVVHNSEHNVSLRKKQDEKYSKEGP
jgi:ribosomal protein S19